jgi:hypothetical protein
MASVNRFPIEKLRLKVNAAKSAAARSGQYKFVGCSTSNDRSERSIAPKTLVEFMAQMGRRYTGRGDQSIAADRRADAIPHWDGAVHFGLCDTRSPTWKRGFAEDYARILGGSGRTGPIASQNRAVVAWAKFNVAVAADSLTGF